MREYVGFFSSLLQRAATARGGAGQRGCGDTVFSNAYFDVAWFTKHV